MFKIGDMVQGISSSEDFYAGIRIGKILEISETKNSLTLEILQHEDYTNNNLIIEVNDFDDYLENMNDIIEIDDISRLIFNHQLDNSKNALNELGNINSAVSNIKSNISNLTKEINQVTQDLIHFKRGDNLATKLVEELNLIKADEKCDEINIDEDYINIITKQIYIEDNEHPEGLFKMNKYDIYMYLKDSNIKIFGLLDDYNRESWWSEDCPHPHISHKGEPCWGNTRGMLVYSMDNKDLYTTFMLIINFLESFNLEDVAGKNIKNWDFVSREDYNEILDNPYNNTCDRPDCGCYVEDYEEEYDGYLCDECGNIVCCDCYTCCDRCNNRICNNHDTTRIYDDYRVCDSCLEEYYVFSEYHDRYIDREDASRCDCCDDYIDSSREDLNETDKYDYYICNDCAYEHYIFSNYHDCYIAASSSYTCGCCDDKFNNSDILTGIPSESCSVCPDCLEEYYAYCVDTDEYIDTQYAKQCDCCDRFFSQELTPIQSENISVCDSCLDEKYVYIDSEEVYISICEAKQCNYCEEFFTTDLTYICSEDISVCDDCLNSNYKLLDDIQEYVVIESSSECN